MPGQNDDSMTFKVSVFNESIIVMQRILPCASLTVYGPISINVCSVMVCETENYIIGFANHKRGVSFAIWVH